MNYKSFLSLDFKCKKWCFVAGLFINWGQSAKNLRFFGKKDWTASSKLHSTFCRRKFEEKIKLFFWEKPDVFIFSRIFGQYFSGYGWKVFDSVVGITIYVSCQRVDEFGFFETSFTIIELWAKRSLTSFRNFRRDCRNYILRVQKFTLGEDFFWKNNFCKSCFWIMNGKNWDFWR